MNRPLLTLVAVLLIAGCDHGLAPPPPPAIGSIEGTITYRGTWPPLDSLRDLRFVAFTFVPQDTSDFFRFNEYVFSEGLRYHVVEDQFRIDSAAAGLYPYSAVAQQFARGVLDWRPVGVFRQDGGVFTVETGKTTRIQLDVDFQNIPHFPPR